MKMLYRILATGRVRESIHAMPNKRQRPHIFSFSGADSYLEDVDDFVVSCSLSTRTIMQERRLETPFERAKSATRTWD